LKKSTFYVLFPLPICSNWYENNTDLLLSSQLTSFTCMLQPHKLLLSDFGEARGAEGQDWGGLLVMVGAGWAVLVARAVLVERAEGSTTFPDRSIPSRLRSLVAEA
jgi:hypothetical protein